MRWLVEHFRAVEEPSAALGVAFAPVGRTDEIEAADEAEAAAVALSSREDEIEVDALGYDPGHGLYALPGEDEAVRVRPAEP
jgi:hypothetical protein